MAGYRYEVDKAKRKILKGIFKNKPTPFAKVCGTTAVDNTAMNELENEKKVETYSERIKITIEEQKKEYYRWVPYTKDGKHVWVTPLLIKKLV